MCRGGSAGSERRPSGGSVNPNNIKDIEDMISARNDENFEYVNQVLTVAQDMIDEYNDDVAIDGVFQMASFENKDASVLGCYSTESGNLTMNKRYLSSPKLDAVMDDAANTGYHPSRGSKTGVQAVTSHEYGHRLTANVQQAMGEKSFDKAAEKIVTQARKETGDRGNIKFAAKISGYAKTSNAETVAEAVADVYCNGSKATAQSKAVVNVINSYLK